MPYKLNDFYIESILMIIENILCVQVFQNSFTQKFFSIEIERQLVKNPGSPVLNSVGQTV